MTHLDYLSTPIGILEIQADDRALTQVIFVDKKTNSAKPNALTGKARQQLTEYFQGERKQFDVPLAKGGTEFQKSVWKSLLAIGFGDTASYRDIANTIDKPKAVRAVGAANGKNPISIIVPCHRVIGADGSLTGYAGGLERKQWLLNHEQAVFND